MSLGHIVLAVLLWPLLVLEGQAQATLTIIRSNGPTSKFINLVYVSEAYATNDLPLFLPHLTNAVNQLFNQSPWSAYSNYFNVFAISVGSMESGSDHLTPAVVTKDTYFNSTYDSSGIQRLITIDSVGASRLNALLASLMPEYDITAMIVNDTVYGGSGGSRLIFSVNSSSAEIGAHEIGHTFARLGDEYSSAYPGYPATEEPNTLTNANLTSSSQVKWKDWILPTTLIPTPNVTSNFTLIGAFEGAHYQATGWYRPGHDCKMRTLGVAYCKVCAQEFILSTYKIIRPIQGFSPSATNFSVDAQGSASFSLDLLKPAVDLNVQWYTNGVAATGGTTTNFSVTSAQLYAGTNRIEAVINDATSYVRTDPGKKLWDTNVWTVTVSSTNLAPSITTQPLSRTVNPGTNVTFSVTASGTVPLYYQWRFNGANIPGATAFDYTRTNVQTNDAGNYSVVVSNLAGTATSANAVLNVNTPPAITAQPQGLTVIGGSNVTFSVTATGTPAPAYQWQFNGTNIAGATVGTYVRNNAQAADAGNYRVVVTNSVGSVTSAVASLVVNYVLNATASSGGTVSRNPDQTSYAPNSSVTLTAASSGVYLFAGWSGDATGINNPLAVTMSTNKNIIATFTNPVPDLVVDNTNAAFVGSWATATAAADEFGPDYRTITTGSSGGASATFTPGIAVAGNYDVYVWYPTISGGGSGAPSPVAPFLIHDADTNLAVTVNQSMGGGDWQLLAAGRRFTPGGGGFVRLTNNAPNPSRTVIADAVRWVYSTSQGSAPAITMQPTNVTAIIGASAAFYAGASGVPPLTWQWRHYGTNISAGTNSALSFASVQIADAGDYAVVVANSSGSITSVVATLTVLVPPGIVSPPTSQHVVQGSPVTFNVSASGTAPLAYQWRFNSAAIANATGPTFTIPSVQPGDLGDYDVTITNLAGAVTSAAAGLTVSVIPVVRAMEVLADGQAQLTIAGTPGDHYTVECSSNLLQWAVLATLTNNLGTVQFTDPAATGLSMRIYRARLVE